jgi:hypothetical protein
MKKNSKAGEHDPAVNAYIDSCLSDIPMMIDRYTHITFVNNQITQSSSGCSIC